ncbi:MAG: hypothetical protein VW771_10680 [Gammaproteobacteria bacterium]
MDMALLLESLTVVGYWGLVFVTAPALMFVFIYLGCVTLVLFAMLWDVIRGGAGMIVGEKASEKA